MNSEGYKKLVVTVLKNFYHRMNDQQFAAIISVNGPLLILAGAGSGKTTVIVNRIAQMVLLGDVMGQTDFSLIPGEEKITQLKYYANKKEDFNGATLQEIFSDLIISKNGDILDNSEDKNRRVEPNELIPDYDGTKEIIETIKRIKTI